MGSSPSYGQRRAEQEAYDEAIAQIQLADRLGFNTVWVVEHHFRDGRSACPSSEVVLGGLALSTNQIRLGFGVTLMPFGFIHPARVAEKVATVDILSHGRVEWGTGRSTPMEQTAFGVPIDDRSATSGRKRSRSWWACGPRRGTPTAARISSSRSACRPQAVPGSTPTGVAGGHQRQQRGQCRALRARLALPFSSRTVEQMAEVIASYHARPGGIRAAHPCQE